MKRKQLHKMLRSIIFKQFFWNSPWFFGLFVVSVQKKYPFVDDGHLTVSRAILWVCEAIFAMPFIIIVFTGSIEAISMTLLLILLLASPFSALLLSAPSYIYLYNKYKDVDMGTPEPRKKTLKENRFNPFDNHF
ncbi:MAG: hypothetical protein FWB93_03450 [Oscillospiraceae bacterium]|nr:hypothetical protein [Oscillospiraceae bacterium]